MSTKPRPVIERALAKVEITATCWLWTGHRNHKGYGRVFIDRSRGPRPAHVVLYEHYRGPVPNGLELDHLCRVRHCVNPDHMEPVTHAENLRRRVRVSHATRPHASHCKYGHQKQPRAGRKYLDCPVCRGAQEKARRERKSQVSS